MKSLNLKAGLVSLLIFLSILGIWFLATQPSGTATPASTAGMTAEQIEYQKLMGKDVGSTKTTGFPTLSQMGAAIWKQVSNPIYDNGPNDKGMLLDFAFAQLQKMVTYVE